MKKTADYPVPDEFQRAMEEDTALKKDISYPDTRTTKGIFILF
ncbi:hypothetical protein HMPREF0765_4200 [Sphingobacterium spiritivorum ATCC 33300]|uniref:Uncharacterized protein n=1 Tax=Sphingobacterium spiritivorum ATCC 33300 TaxID=525372 RepID=C2G3P4_SPHSI|nr:hypothetical protein [Sphingobacterium spiritivorum]EEI90249.1 hypothetical protein HMPREF0765_4200 [Sphingobacterium spiritivorum ATCC 33300]